MLIGEMCTRDVVTCSMDATLLDVARLMRRSHVGAVVVTGSGEREHVPLGIITDRDIVVEVVANEVDAATLKAGDVIGPELVTAGAAEGLFEVVQRMHLKGVRRLPVVDEKGELTGIVTIDDMVEVLAAEMMELAKVISREQLREERTRG